VIDRLLPFAMVRAIALRALPVLIVLSLACAPGPYLQAQAPAPRGGAAAATVQAPASVLLNAKDSVKFLVIGDSGTGGSQQYEVADQIVRAHDRFKFEFAIMLGDNLYGSEDPSDYVKKFERPYKKLLDAEVKFYAALGNHDEPAQRFYKPFNMDGKRYYTFRKDDVEFFVLDSTYMTPDQIKWLSGVLEQSDAKWKIAYFHHPIYSSGEKHGSELDLQVLVEPLFVQHGVDVVFSGHEHFYERIKPQKGIYYITQGGAAKLREGNIRARSPITERGFDTDNSFTLVEIVKDQLHFETISRRGQVVDSGSFPRREVTPMIGPAPQRSSD
jgi:predicted phosphodiesterase